jgi:hypothetical protein
MIAPTRSTIDGAASVALAASCVNFVQLLSMVWLQS